MVGIHRGLCWGTVVESIAARWPASPRHSHRDLLDQSARRGDGGRCRVPGTLGGAVNDQLHGGLGASDLQPTNGLAAGELFAQGGAAGDRDGGLAAAESWYTVNLLELANLTAKHIEEDRTQALRWYSDLAIYNAINDGLTIHTSLSMCIESTVAITMAPLNPFYELFTADSRTIAVLRVTENTVRLAPDNIGAFKAANNSWRNQPGIPENFAVVGSNLLAVEPVPANNSIQVQVTIARVANGLINTGDVPEIPEEDHAALAEYAAWFLETAKFGASEKTQQRLGRFLETVAARADQTIDRCRSRNYLTQPLPIDKTRIAALIGAASERRNRSI